MKQIRAIGYVLAVVSMMFSNVAVADDAGAIYYRHTSDKGTAELVIDVDRALHFTADGAIEPKSFEATIGSDEYKKLQAAAHSDAFAKLEKDYVKNGTFDGGVDLEVRANGKTVMVVDKKAPAGLQPLLDLLNKLEKKYVKTDAAVMGPIQYHHSWMKGSVDITIGSDKVMHYKGGRVAKPAELTTKITDEEYAQLREAVGDKDFAKLKDAYVNRNVRDGFMTSVTVNGKEVTVENAEPPAVLQKLLDVIHTLEKKYVKE